METVDIIGLYFLQCKNNCLTLRITKSILKRQFSNNFPLMASFKYSRIFYNGLEMPLHDINTSVQLWLYSKMLSLVVFNPDNVWLRWKNTLIHQDATLLSVFHFVSNRAHGKSSSLPQLRAISAFFFLSKRFDRFLRREGDRIKSTALK